MLRKLSVKSNLFKQLSACADNFLTELISIHSSFSNRLTKITAYALSICDTTISNHNKSQQLATNQLTQIAADISNLRGQLIAFCQDPIKKISSIKPKELQQRKLAKDIASNLQQKLNKELVVAADVICQLSKCCAKQQSNMRQQQETSLLNLLHLQNDLTRKLERLKTFLKQQVALAVLKILQTKNNFRTCLSTQLTPGLVNNIMIELQQQLQNTMIQVLQHSQQVITTVEQLLDIEPFKIVALQPVIINAQQKIYNIKQQNLHNAKLSLGICTNKRANSKIFLAI